MENKAIAPKGNIYINQAMISNKTLDSKTNNLQMTKNSDVIVSNNSEVTVINTAGHKHETNLSTEGLSHVYQCLDIKIFRNAKKDTNTVYNVSENYISIDTNKNVNSVDMPYIKESKILRTTLITVEGNRKSIFQTKRY